MKGYYVIPTNGEPIEFMGKGAKSKALKMAKEIFNKGDAEVFMQRFDDDNHDGYFSNEEIIRIVDIS